MLTSALLRQLSAQEAMEMLFLQRGLPNRLTEAQHCRAHPARNHCSVALAVCLFKAPQPLEGGRLQPRNYR